MELSVSLHAPAALPPGKGPVTVEYRYAPHNDVSVNDGGLIRL
jgi:hypothetical protein